MINELSDFDGVNDLAKTAQMVENANLAILTRLPICRHRGNY